jgi:hypothetical protein
MAHIYRAIPSKRHTSGIQVIRSGVPDPGKDKKVGKRLPPITLSGFFWMQDKREMMAIIIPGNSPSVITNRRSNLDFIFFLASLLLHCFFIAYA